MLRVSMRVAGVAAALAVLWGSSAAGAATIGHGLRWHSPRKVSSGVPIAVASKQSCPPVPTPGDTTLVGVSLNFTGGVLATTLAPNPDGSWAGDVIFTFFVPLTGPTTLSANCIDFNGHGGTVYADYTTRSVRIVPK